jgi:hypothetical protein
MAAPDDPRDQKWCALARQASEEMDSAKLSLLVAQLCAALDERQNPPESLTPSSCAALASFPPRQ